MSTALCFNDVSFDVIPQNSQPWVRGPQIAVALNYSRADRVNEIYTRHADEFTEAMTAVVTLPTEGGPQETRIFSLRGCHLIAMFARTPVAKQFRHWVLDVLDKLEQQKPKRGRPAKALPSASSSTPAPNLPETVLEPHVYLKGRQLFDLMNKLMNDFDLVKTHVQLRAHPGARLTHLSPELEALYRAAADASKMALCALNEAQFALRIAMQIKADHDFVGRI